MLCHCHKKQINYMNIIRNFFKIWIKPCLALYWTSLLMLLWLFMVCEIPPFRCSFSHIHSRKSLTFTLVLTTTIIRALPLPRRHCPIFTAEMQTCPQALNLLSAYNTLTVRECTSVIVQKNCFESHILQIIPASERGHRYNVAFMTETLQKCCGKKWNSK